MHKILLLMLLLGALAFAQTKAQMPAQVQGTLDASHGGTGNTSNGNNGQVLVGDGVGHFTPQDPIVSQAYVNLMNAVVATATNTGSIVRIPTLTAFGTLYVTFAGITGSPSGCTLQLKNYDSLGNGTNNGATITLTVANGQSTFNVTSASGLYNAAQLSATYVCTTYPTAGTISVDMTVSQAVAVIFAVLPSNASQETGGNLATLAGGVTGSVYQENLKQIAGSTVVADPCQVNTINFVSISQTANAQLISGTASKKIYVCSVNVVTATTQNVALVEGTGTVCATGTTGVQGFGGATASTGWNFGANGGIAYGAGGHAIGAEGTTADNLCLFQSGTGQVSGGIRYVVQ